MPPRQTSPLETSRPKKIPKMENSIDVVSATTSMQPIPSYRPDAKARRYDRQLRLWASAGQRSLEQARVLLVGCDASGCQSLKNLVLPGIAHFTILTASKTTSQDVATNFFLHPDSIGASLAAETVKYLKELNPAVEGVAKIEDPAVLLSSDANFFTSFTLIVCSNLDPDIEIKLADLIWQHSALQGNESIPLVSIRNSGFIGRIGIQIREHCVVDTHPDSTHTLRIDQPFPELEKYARGLDLVSMDSMEHSHVPYLILLVRALCDWKDSHDGQAPNYETRDEFKALIKKGERKGDEENYEEALGQAFKCWNISEVPYESQALLDRDNVQNIFSESQNLHLLLHALGEYLKTHTLPPLSPSLPDMHSSTTSYIALQNMFKRQYLADLAEYQQILSLVLQRVGLSSDSISDEEIQNFVKNSAGVDIVNGTALSGQRDPSGLTKEIIQDHLNDEESENHLAIAEHLALIAAERFKVSSGKWPGTGSKGEAASDQQTMETMVKDMTGSAELPNAASEAVTEVIRGGSDTLPTTAAFIGGVVAQEAIKLVTRQYTPLDNTVIIDLIRSTTTAFKL